MNNSDKIWVGFDLGGTKMLAQVLSDELKPLGKKRRKTKGNQGSDEGTDRIIRTIEEAIVDAKAAGRPLGGIGIGCPGPIQRKKGILIEAPNLGWKDVPLRDILQKKFKCPVILANDVDVGVYGEYALGAGRNARCLLGVFPGTGIGGGLVYKGELFQGKSGTCLEIGHIPVQPEGPLCGCGQRGCLEAVASRLSIASAAAAAAYRGQAPLLLEKAGADLENIRSSVLAASVIAGEKAIVDIVRQAAQWLGIGVATAVNLLSPDTVVLGGGLVEALPDFFKKEVEATARQRVMKAYRDTFTVKIAELGDDAGALGAGAWARAQAGAPEGTAV